MRSGLRESFTLASAQEYVIINLLDGSYVAVYGDGSRGRDRADPRRPHLAVTLASKQEYAVVYLPSGSYVKVSGDGTRSTGAAAALKRYLEREVTFTVHAKPLDDSEEGAEGFDLDLDSFETWLAGVLATADFGLRVWLG
jgi:hypothetical protein